ncbi:MAG: site-2 protease family protein [Spirochaetaceae bacterium]
MILTIILGLLGLGVVVFVHELGHFLAAKASGITVEAFSIGWGKPLLRRTWRGTEYRLGMLPIGGYCKMKGEELFQKALEDKQDRIYQEEGSLFSAPVGKRLLTYIAGPAFNFIFSVLVLSLIWFIGFSVETFENRVILVSEYPSLFEEQEYPADKAGLQTGDRIVEIDGREVDTYSDIRQIIAKSPRETLPLRVKRGGRDISLTISPDLDKSTGAGQIGVAAWIEPVIDTVEDGSSAKAAGLQPGDRITAVAGKETEHYLDIFQALSDTPEKVSVTYTREGLRGTADVSPEYDEGGNPNIGISFRGIEDKSPRVGPFSAIARGASESIETFALTIKGIGLLFSGVDVKQAVSGPIRITYMVGEVATSSFSEGSGSGLITLFRFLSFLSVALCFGNLLPIPALDGGFIVLSLVELVKGSSVSPKTFYRYQTVGFFIVIIILFLTTFGDITYLFSQ